MEEEVRTRYELEMDVRFSARYHALIEQWYLLLNDATTVLGLLLAVGVVASVVKEYPVAAAALAAIAAVFHATNLVLGSVRRAQLHREQYQRFQELDAKLSANELTDEQGEKEYRLIEVKDPAINEAFRNLAYVENLRTHGHKDEAAKFESSMSMRERALRSAL